MTMQRCNRGVSLVELMISLTLGLLIIQGVSEIYLAARKTFRNEDALARMQENARTAFDYLARDLRMTGFIGCAPALAESGIINILHQADSVWYKNMIAQPLIGYDNASQSRWPRFPAELAGVTGSVIAGDVISVLHADNSQVLRVRRHDKGKFQFTLDQPHTVKQGTLLIVTEADCSRTAVFQNTDSSDNDSILQHGSGAHAGDTQSLGSPQGALYTFQPNASIYPLSASTYFIGKADPDSIANNGDEYPALFVEKLYANASTHMPATRREELIDGVQDMQIVYGEDLDGDRNADQYVTANNVTDWTRILAVNISLLMVSRPDEPGISEHNAVYAIDRNGDGDTDDNGETSIAHDHLLRKLFNSSISLRNRQAL
jgi:type IV pilus assembly protein PilW